MGLFDFLKKKKEAPEPPKQEKKALKKMGIFPQTVGDATLKYYYVVPLSPAEGRSIADVLDNEQKIVDVSAADGKVIFSYNGDAFAYLDNEQKAKMVSDFIKREDPVHAVLLSETEANLRFYRSLAKAGAKREQTVTPLTGYKGRSRQETVSLLSEGDELEVNDEDDKITLLYMGEVVGGLPAKIAKRILEDGCLGVAVENIETEENDDMEEIFVPNVRIYW